MGHRRRGRADGAPKPVCGGTAARPMGPHTASYRPRALAMVQPIRLLCLQGPAGAPGGRWTPAILSAMAVATRSRPGSSEKHTTSIYKQLYGLSWVYATNV
eukprot:347484-Chlamydomonas_euryale.AAC.1